jgi:DNA-binding transcriptional LysR family regulator
LHQLLAPFGIVPRILEVPHSCAVQLAYAGAGEGIVFATSSMMKCSFPDVVAIPFAEKLPERQLGIVSMESNKSPALDIFRRVAIRSFAATEDPVGSGARGPFVATSTIALGA